MTSLREAAQAWIACVEHGTGSLGRIAFWIEQLGDKPIADITEQDVDLALVALARRGKLKGGRGRLNPPIPTGLPLAPASIHRFISTLAGLYKNSRKLRLLPRSHTPPTQGIEKFPETVDPDKYFRPDEVEKLLAVATAIDQRWKKLPALIFVGLSYWPACWEFAFSALARCRFGAGGCQRFCHEKRSPARGGANTSLRGCAE